MKAIATALLLAAAFYLGTQYVLVPRGKEQASCQAPAKRAGAKPAPKPARPAPGAIDLGF